VAVAWFIGPYVRDDTAGHEYPARFFLSADFFEQLALNGGTWAGPVEILGNHAILKVRAGAGVLQAIDDLPDVDGIAKDLLDDQLADLPPAAQQRLRDLALELGYTLQELNDRFPEPIGTYTLGDVLRFLGSRWRRPFYDGKFIVFEEFDSEPPTTVDRLGDI